MHINDFLALLPHEATKSNGETMCRCPCHADKKASLSVKMGDKGIVLHCHAGCSTADIVEALGLKMSDLFAEPIQSDGQKKPARRKAAAADTVAGKTVHTVEPKKPLGKPEKVYHYTDENGKLLFDVMRFRLPDGDKTFRQAIPDPSKPGGYNWSTKDVRHPLYNLPAVIAAIKAGQPVYVVEGEKDADNLIAAGLCATTNPGGASKPGTKIKWLDEHTDALNGADVIVLPDNDQVGVSDRIQVCEKLLGVAKSIRWIDLLALCPTLPTKGDVSDYLEIAGAESGLRELQRAVQAAPKLNQRLIQELKPPIQQATEAFSSVPGYCVENGVICAMTGNPPYPKPLCSFLCIPRAEITQDDGVSVSTVHLIDGWDKMGVPLPQVRVPTRNYKGMTWVSENWGFRANILPGNTVADKLRYVIAEVGYRSSRRVIEYTHAGWRCIKGKWTYLYIDVCSGAKNLERVQYQRMLEDCRAGRIDTIMTKSINRFGRDTVEVISTLRELNQLGINVIFEKDNIDTATEDSELVITIISAVAQADNESRRKNIQWGMAKRAEDGTSGFYRRRCYGYEHDENGKLAIKTDEAEIVRHVYAAYLEGRSFHAIARELTEKGVPSPNGKAQWCNRTIDVMLSNEKYAGDVILFKTVSAAELFGEDHNPA